MEERMAEEATHLEEESHEESPPGFISKEQWVDMGRDPDDWRSPEEFKERGDKITGVLKQQRDELKAEIDSFKRDFEQYRTHQQQVTSQKEQEAYERAKREYEEQLSSIRAAKRQAVEEMDGDGFVKAEAMEDALKPPAPPAQHQPQAQSGVNPEFVNWQSRNDWYSQDAELREYADYLSTKYVDDVKSGRMTVAQALDDVGAKVKKQFSHKFENQRRNEPPVTTEGEPTRRNAGKSYRDLPGDAKAACDRFVKRGIMTKEQYIKDYFGE